MLPKINPWLYGVLRVLLTLIFRLYMPTRVRGKRHLRRPGSYILVANHSSNLDAPLLGWAVRPLQPYTMAKAELWDIAPVGWLAGNLGAFPVNRDVKDSSAMRTSLAILKAGRVLMMFPEGTFAYEGTALPLRSGVVRLAVKLRCPIVPAYLDGTHRAWPGHNIFPRPARLRVSFGPAFELSDFYEGKLTDERLEQAVEQVRERIWRLAPTPQP